VNGGFVRFAGRMRPPMTGQTRNRMTGAGGLRASEWILLIYFSYVTLLPLWVPVAARISRRVLVVNLAAALVYAAVIGLQRRRYRDGLDIARDWMPTPLMMLAYQEMGWFAQPHTSFALEEAWVVLDRRFLNDWGVKAVIESLGPVLPGLLEISYTLVYSIPFIVLAALYLAHRRERVDAFLTLFLTGILSCYVLFPYFPSEPPRTVFPGQDFPSYLTIFRRFNWAMLGDYGIHTSVFPSAHVAGAFCGAFGARWLLPEQRALGWFLLVLATLIATSVVYGRYHYLVDALAGLACTGWALFVTRGLLARRW
jgi:membrane-associated phospholipid phosphatase